MNDFQGITYHIFKIVEGNLTSRNKIAGKNGNGKRVKIEKIIRGRTMTEMDDTGKGDL